MKISNERILTTHVGSLPRSKAVTDVVFAKENSQIVNRETFNDTIKKAVDAVVERQAKSGVDIVSDGEMSKISYATYIKDRITGFQGDSPPQSTRRPRVLDSTTNFIGHPQLIAQRIETFANIVGRERVIAGTDCGFSTFAGFGAVEEDIVYAKLAAMAEGAAIATKRLWKSVVVTP